MSLSIVTGKVNVVVQTDRTYGPNTILKRRKPKDPSLAADDHRDNCGGVGSEAVKAPDMVRRFMSVNLTVVFGRLSLWLPTAMGVEREFLCERG